MRGGYEERARPTRSSPIGPALHEDGGSLLSNVSWALPDPSHRMCAAYRPKSVSSSAVGVSGVILVRAVPGWILTVNSLQRHGCGCDEVDVLCR